MAPMKRPAPLHTPNLPRVVTAVALADCGEGKKNGLPTRMRVLKWGENPNSQDVPVRVGSQLPAAMAAATYPFHQIALDYEHNTWPGSKAYQETREPREVAAFLTVEAVEGDGVYVNVDRWTPSGERNAHNYCDLSATPLLDGDGNVTAIVSVALTRTGAVPDIAFAQAAAMSAINPTTHGDAMNWKEILAKQFGLQPDCTDEELQTAWAAHLEAVQTAKDAAKAAAKPADAAPAADGAVALSAEAIGGIVAKAVKALTDPLASRLDSQEKRKIIADAQGEGKVVALADTLLARMTIDELSAHVKALPTVVPLAAVTPVTLKEGKTVTLSAVELSVCQALGLSAEAYAKEKEAGK